MFWFLSQAILFRELTKFLPRPVLVILAIIVGSTFIFLLYLGMNKLINFVKKNVEVKTGIKINLEVKIIE